ncbi:hypothetical protein ACFWGC_26925 [Cytobacillus pseudoceanisediminis]
MGFWKEEWNKLEEDEKMRFIKTFITPVFLIIAIFVTTMVLGAVVNVVSR